MHPREWLTPSTDAVVAALAGLAALMGSFAVTGVSRSFVGSPVQTLIADITPIELVVFMIQTFGDLGQQINFLAALATVVIVVAAMARLAIYGARRVDEPLLAPLATGAGAWVFTVLFTGEPFLSLGAGVPAGLAVLAPRLARMATDRDRPISSRRRRVLATVGAGGGIVGLGYFSGTRLATDASPSRRSDAPTVDTADATPEPGRDDGAGDSDSAATEEPPGADVELSGPNVDAAEIATGLEGAASLNLDLGDVEPLISEDFYEVDINSIDPDIAPEDWSLSVTGAATETFELSFQDVLELPAENRFVTLRCVSDDLDGNKLDNALWTGVHIEELLDRAQPTSDCNCVRLHAADGYFQVFPMAAFEDSLLAYGMNGRPLPQGHGAPLRTLVPGHWGEINVKWLTEIEFLNEDADGYWEQRGWHGTGPVVPIAKIEHETLREDGTRELGGRAYGGTRGVARVEVSIDGGETWSDAELSAPLSSVETPGEGSIDASDALRQWRFAYEPPIEPHTVYARMVDENGDVQPSEERDPFPRGASGWVSREYR